jgi:alpha,alpha-trehalose phosphorylase
VGQLQLAYDYLGETAFIDLQDLGNNGRDGIHLASLAGTWAALVAGFGGMRLHNGSLSFAPRLPDGITRLAFRIMFRSRRLYVEAKAKEATYHLLDGLPLIVQHYNKEIKLLLDEPTTLLIPCIQTGPRPSQPFGRTPIARGKNLFVGEFSEAL